MFRREERAKGVIVKILDMSELEAQALEYRQKTRPDCYEVKIYGGETAVATDNSGTTYVLCTEGVGYPVIDDKLVEFDFHGSYYIRDDETGEISPNKHSFDAMSFGGCSVTLDELLENYPVKEEKDLSEFVRTFGDRLENNFWLWFNTLSK